MVTSRVISFFVVKSFVDQLTFHDVFIIVQISPPF